MTARRAKVMYYALWGFALWAVLFSSVAVWFMFDMSNQLEDSCVSRQKARTAIRQSFANRPNWTVEEQVFLDENLPPRVKC